MQKWIKREVEAEVGEDILKDDEKGEGGGE